MNWSSYDGASKLVGATISVGYVKYQVIIPKEVITEFNRDAFIMCLKADTGSVVSVVSIYLL